MEVNTRSRQWLETKCKVLSRAVTGIQKGFFTGVLARCAAQLALLRRFQAKADCDKYFESALREWKLRDVESALAEPSKKVASELFPTQIAPWNKLPDLQRLFYTSCHRQPCCEKVSGNLFCNHHGGASCLNQLG